MQLHLMSSESTGDAHGLVETPVVIGRGETVEVHISDIWASRRHCELKEEDGKLVLRDLKSTHGTIVNGQIVTEAVLKPGDEITIGLTRLTIHWKESERTKHQPNAGGVESSQAR